MLYTPHDNDLCNDIVDGATLMLNLTIVTISSKINMSRLDDIVAIFEFHPGRCIVDDIVA